MLVGTPGSWSSSQHQQPALPPDPSGISSVHPSSLWGDPATPPFSEEEAEAQRGRYEKTPCTAPAGALGVAMLLSAPLHSGANGAASEEE